MRGGAVHSIRPDQVGPRAADDLTTREAHSQPAVSAAVVGQAVSRHHCADLGHGALRVKVAPAAVLTVQLRLRVRVCAAEENSHKQADT